MVYRKDPIQTLPLSVPILANLRPQKEEEGRSQA